MSQDSKQPISLQWNRLTIDALHSIEAPAPIAARSLAMVHTAMYDAWSIYNSGAISTSSGIFIKASEDQCNKETVRKAFSYAAYRILNEIFCSVLPADKKHIFREFMCQLDYDPDDYSLSTTTPQGIGNLVAKMVSSYRRGDGSNSQGKLSMPSWSDYTGYYTNGQNNNAGYLKPMNGEYSPDVHRQEFPLSHWGLVRPFALHFNSQFRPDPPYCEADDEFRQQAEEILEISACLTDEQKAIAEYWSGPGCNTMPGRWCDIAHFVLRNETRNSICIKILFALSNAMLDASIACWESKRFYNAPRPVSVIPYLFESEDVQAWAGPCKGTRTIKGKNWQSYTHTPSTPEHVSDHASFSRAAAVVLKNFTGSDNFGGCYVVKKSSSKIEPGCGIPCVDVRLEWPTFSAAAIQAAQSQLYTGIHFKRGIELGLILGNYAGTQAWEKAQYYFNEHVYA